MFLPNTSRRFKTLVALMFTALTLCSVSVAQADRRVAIVRGDTARARISGYATFYGTVASGIVCIQPLSGVGGNYLLGSATKLIFTSYGARIEGVGTWSVDGRPRLTNYANFTMDVYASGRYVTYKITRGTTTLFSGTTEALRTGYITIIR